MRRHPARKRGDWEEAKADGQVQIGKGARGDPRQAPRPCMCTIPYPHPYSQGTHTMPQPAYTRPQSAPEEEQQVPLASGRAHQPAAGVVAWRLEGRDDQVLGARGCAAAIRWLGREGCERAASTFARDATTSQHAYRLVPHTRGLPLSNLAHAFDSTRVGAYQCMELPRLHYDTVRRSHEVPFQGCSRGGP